MKLSCPSNPGELYLELKMFRRGFLWSEWMKTWSVRELGRSSIESKSFEVPCPEGTETYWVNWHAEVNAESLFSFADGETSATVTCS